MKLHDAMKELLGQFGSTLLQESRLFSMLADYRAFSDYPAMRQVVKELVARRYLSELYWRSRKRAGRSACFTRSTSENLYGRPGGSGLSSRVTPCTVSSLPWAL